MWGNNLRGQLEPRGRSKTHVGWKCLWYVWNRPALLQIDQMSASLVLWLIGMCASLIEAWWLNEAWHCTGVRAFLAEWVCMCVYLFSDGCGSGSPASIWSKGRKSERWRGRKGWATDSPMTSQRRAARGREGEMAQIEEIKRTDKRRGGGGGGESW